MARPVVGIIGNRHLIQNSYLVHGGSVVNSGAVATLADAVPLIVPADPGLCDVEDLLAACDGFLFTGGRPNVHPAEYGEVPTPAHGTFDRGRDDVALGLIRALTERGQPYFAICRGFQEVAVAFGSVLHPEIRDLPGRMNHRMPPDGTIEEKFALRHPVRFTEGGVFHRLLGTTQAMTNTAHGQGVATPGARFVVEGWAPDGTPEAAIVADAPGFALSVQWHPEYRAQDDPVSRLLFGGFGAALRDWQAGRRPAGIRRIA